MTEVRRLRKERGLTIAQLADLAKISVNTIVKMEKSADKRKGGISLSAASLVASALNTPIDEIFPNMVLNYNQGRPAQTGSGSLNTRPIPIIAFCPDCRQSVSVSEKIAGTSECCSAALAA